MVFKNIHSDKTAGLWWQRSVPFICLVLLALWWDSELDSVCVCVALCCVSLLRALPGPGRPSKVRWSYKRFARDIDLTRSLHHTLISVTIIQTTNSASVILSTWLEYSRTTAEVATQALMGSRAQKAVLPEQTPLNNCFYFGGPDTLVHFSSK